MVRGSEVSFEYIESPEVESGNDRMKSFTLTINKNPKIIKKTIKIDSDTVNLLNGINHPK